MLHLNFTHFSYLGHSATWLHRRASQVQQQYIAVLQSRLLRKHDTMTIELLSMCICATFCPNLGIFENTWGEAAAIYSCQELATAPYKESCACRQVRVEPPYLGEIGQAASAALRLFGFKPGAPAFSAWGASGGVPFGPAKEEELNLCMSPCPMS